MHVSEWHTLHDTTLLLCIQFVHAAMLSAVVGLLLQQVVYVQVTDEGIYSLIRQAVKTQDVFDAYGLRVLARCHSHCQQ